MKVITIVDSTNPVSDLVPGEVFMRDKDIYMVTQQTLSDDSICCVNLRTGSFIYIPPEYKITVVDAELKIER